ncbi:MAG: nuclear transport factor 2 family protein [Acidobacteriota bacterium]
MKFLLLTLVITATFALAQEKNLSPSFSTMVATERAFARFAVERGFRDSFITFFADDGIGFTPKPVKTRQDLMSQPPPDSPSPVTFNWTPVYGDISAAGDLGYNTGPVVYEDRGPNKRPNRHGLFFSVWRKQKDGSWKVALDIGVGVPQAVAPLDAPFVPAPSERIKASEVQPAEGRSRILKTDREFLAAAASRPIEAAYRDWLHDAARMHQPRKMPLIGRKAVLESLAAEKVTLSGEPIDGGMSQSGDLAFVYGSYDLKNAESGASSETGYYARVWKLSKSGKWQIVANITNPLPPPER